MHHVENFVANKSSAFAICMNTRPSIRWIEPLGSTELRTIITEPALLSDFALEPVILQLATAGAVPIPHYRFSWIVKCNQRRCDQVSLYLHLHSMNGAFDCGRFSCSTDVRGSLREALRTTVKRREELCNTLVDCWNLGFGEEATWVRCHCTFVTVLVAPSPTLLCIGSLFSPSEKWVLTKHLA